MASIARTRVLRGVEIPAIIHNSSYFLVELEIYEDGLINCWGMVDIPMFRDKLANGWVVSIVPPDKNLSLHGIGDVQLRNPTWQHDTDSLLHTVQEQIKALNPRQENLYNCHGRDTEIVNGLRYAAVSTGNPRPWKTEEPVTPLSRGDFGHELKAFQVVEKHLVLVTLHLFADKTVLIYGAGKTQTMSFGECSAQLRRSDCFRLPQAGDRVHIEGLVAFESGDWSWQVEAEELAREFDDLCQQVLGQPGAVQACRQAFEDYKAKPSDARRELLKEKYEAIPEHLRIYCGDMDSKDWPIRHAIYGPEPEGQ